jgi:release factor glutamine methyltransferase
VFVPRRRSEFLAQQAIARTRATSVVVDLCCGTGALGAAVRAARPGIELYAADIDPTEVECARRNLGDGVYAGDLFAALPAQLQGRIDVLVVNAPYVPTDNVALMPPEARLHEAPVALDGGPDGLDIQRRVIAGAPSWLAPGGAVLIETSVRQSPVSLDLLARSGLATELMRDEDLDATVVIGTA